MVNTQANFWQSTGRVSEPRLRQTVKLEHDQKLGDSDETDGLVTSVQVMWLWGQTPQMLGVQVCIMSM